MVKKLNLIKRIFKKHNGYARTKEIISEGIHTRDIKSLVDNNLIVKVKSGLYRLPNTNVIANQSFIDISQAIPGGIVCLLSALSFYELTTFNPSVISIAIHRKQWRPQIDYPPVDVYFFSQKQYESGINEIAIKNQVIKIYCKEKTICDCFRYRNKLGLDVAKEGLSEYLKLNNRDLDLLIEYAKICRIKNILEIWLNAMI